MAGLTALTLVDTRDGGSPEVTLAETEVAIRVVPWEFPDRQSFSESHAAMVVFQLPPMQYEELPKGEGSEGASCPQDQTAPELTPMRWEEPHGTPTAGPRG